MAVNLTPAALTIKTNNEWSLQVNEIRDALTEKKPD
jgi:hypothetical protein